MTITQKQRQQRRYNVCSSDAATLLRVRSNPSEYDLFLEKTGQVEEIPVDPDVVRLGNNLEDGLLRCVREDLGVALIRNQYRVLPQFHLGAHIDAITRTETPEPVEAKTVSYWASEQWGSPGTDEVPDAVLVQTHVHLACMSKGDYKPQKCYVPALIAGRFQLYVVTRNEDLIQAICEASKRFWEDHVMTGIPPEYSAPSYDVVRYIKRVPDKIVQGDIQKLLDWRESADALSRIKKEEEERKAAFLASMEDAEVADCGQWGHVTMKEVIVKEYTVPAKTYRRPFYSKKPLVREITAGDERLRIEGPEEEK